MLILALIYVAIATLALALLAATRLKTAWSLALIFVLPVVSFAIWQAAQPPTGWPAHVLPPKGEFQGGYVREPEPGDPGEIDLWILPPGASQPRAYKLPYTRRLHEQVEAAKKQGGGVAVRKSAIRRGAHGASRGQYVFYKFPPPDAGPKG